MEFFKKVPRIRFMALRRRWYLLSAVMVLGSIALAATHGLNLAIDFTGGIVVEVGFSKDVDLEQARAALAAGGLTDSQVQNFGTARDVLVRLPPVDERSLAAVTETVVAAMRGIDPGVQLRRTEAIGPQVGAELAEQASLAMLMTLLLILIYIAFRFRWRFGVGAIVASLHDPIVALGIVAVVGLPFDLTVVAGLLTVLGYSVNDTVVVFDRVRERFHSMRKAAPAEVMDLAVNETLSRTIITSGTALSSVLALLIFGGDALRGFSLTLAVGIVVGTYSSIYVANAIALDLGASQRDFLTHEEKRETDGMP
jgi:preprotein translocase subunit SecF